MAVTPEGAAPAHGHGEYWTRRSVPGRAQRSGGSSTLPGWFWPTMLFFAAFLFAAVLWLKFGSASSQQPPAPTVPARVDVYHHRVPAPPKPKPTSAPATSVKDGPITYDTPASHGPIMSEPGVGKDITRIDYEGHRCDRGDGKGTRGFWGREKGRTDVPSACFLW